MVSTPATLWPWVEGKPRPLPPTLPGGQPWPRISIITPSFNQARFIEETILSIANQGYDNVEHIVIDGGSNDGTVEILKRYGSHLSYWESEPDRGQSHAINKGFSRATGEILTWLNSDDRLAPGALAAVALAHHMTGADLFAGLCDLFDGSGIFVTHMPSCTSAPLALADFLDDEFLREGWSFYQPEVMFTRDLWRRAGGRVDEDLHYVMDYDLWLRFAAAGARLQVLGRPIAQFRFHDLQKTGQIPGNDAFTARHAAEVSRVRSRYTGIESQPTQFPQRHRGERRKNPLVIDCNGTQPDLRTGSPIGRAMEALALAGHEVRLAPRPAAGDPSPIAKSDAILISGDAERSAVSNLPVLIAKSASVGLTTAARTQSMPAGFSAATFQPRPKGELRRTLSVPEHGLIMAVSASSPDARRRLAQISALTQKLGYRDIVVLAVGATRLSAFGLTNVRATGCIKTAKQRAEWLAAADVLVAAGADDPTADMAVEAALCGVPTVAYDTANLRGAIIDGVSGILVPQGDEVALRQELARLLTDEDYREALGKWGRIAMENTRSLAAGYYAVQRAFLETGALQVWRDQVWIRFDPAISDVGLPMSTVARSAAYAPAIVGDRIMLRPPTSTGKAAERNGPIFLGLRTLARVIFPRRRPEWVKRVGSLLEN